MAERRNKSLCQQIEGQETLTWTSPVLVVVCGLQGTGKTTVSAHISDLTQSDLFRTDVVRKSLFAEPMYTEDEMQAVYEEMFRLAQQSLSDGSGVILDATFKNEKNRARAKSLSREMETHYFLLEVVVDDEAIIKERMRQRAGDESDARFEHYLETREIFEPTNNAHVIDNSEGIETTLTQVNSLFFGSE